LQKNGVNIIGTSPQEIEELRRLLDEYERSRR